MQNTFLLQVFHGLPVSEYRRVRNYLRSPYHNHRADVLRLFDWLVDQRQLPGERDYDAGAAFAAVYPGRPFHPAEWHLVMRYLLDLLERYLALEEWQAEPARRSLYLLRALRRRELGPHFERQALRLQRRQRDQTGRHAGFYLLDYELQKEIFEYRIVGERNWQENLPAVVDALGHFFALETLRWSGMIAALQLRSGAQLPRPALAGAVHEYALQPGQPLSLQIQYFAAQILAQPDDEKAFPALCALLPHSIGLFPASQCRDLYMAAINFCIRRQNKGDRAYTHRALDLYRQAMEKEILLENGVLPRYTYHNINALAHLAGEGAWAEAFLEEARILLPPSTRESTYRYNLAICRFRQRDYSGALELLRTVESDEIFVQLDIRRMLLRAYFELGEWLALHSLLTSFKAFLQRKKDLGYHRETYLNLIKFTQKLVKVYQRSRDKRAPLKTRIEQTPQVAERDWLLEKLNA